MAPATTQAVVMVEKGKAGIQEVPVPKLRDGYILVKVKAVAINPTDWKHAEIPFAAPGNLLGCDYAGIVEEIAPGVTKSFKKGDRIAGMAHGGDIYHPESGSFSHYITVKGDVQIKVPDSFSDYDAATLGVSVATVGQGLYQTLSLPLDCLSEDPSSKKTLAKEAEEKPYILICGGSTATGIYGIQFAIRSGYRVIATSSPKNFDYLKSLGAEAVFDYNSPTSGGEIRKLTDNNLFLAWDCTGTAASLAAAALSDKEGKSKKYGSIMPCERSEIDAVNPSVEGPLLTLAYSIFGEAFRKGDSYVADDVEGDLKRDFEFAKSFMGDVVEGMLKRKELVAPKAFVNEGGEGLEGVLKGLELSKEGKVSGGKLVYEL